VDFAGWVQPTAVPDLINRCTLVLMPSRYEGLPLVAVQAAWMARPTVATRVGGNAEVVLHAETGLVIEPDDPAALAESAIRLLDDPRTAQAMGHAAREHARRVFDEKPCVEQYAAIYRRMMAARSARQAPRASSCREVIS
jgi:glycosyltransferase involved in cell wall biosynthesis